jgi:hypothetical protein
MAPPNQGPIPIQVSPNDYTIEVGPDGQDKLVLNKQGKIWESGFLGQDHINSKISPEFFLDEATGTWFANFTRTGETLKKQLPAGFHYSMDEARIAAEESGLKGPTATMDFQGIGLVQTPAEYELLVKNGIWTFERAGENKKEADKRYSVQIDRTTGDLIRVDLDAEPGEGGVLPSTIISKAPTKPEVGWKKILSEEPIDLGNGNFLHAYEVTASDGTTSIKYVTTETPDTQDIGSNIALGDGKGDLVYLGDGRYEHVPDIEAPFEHKAGDVIPLPSQNGSLIKTSKNQYQFVRESFTPGVMEYTDEQGITRQFTQSASGTWTDLAPRAESGVIESGGRDFLQQTTGALTELDPRYDPSVTDVDGMKLLQQTTGQIGQLTPPNMDQIITQALVDGEYDKAFAFQDFRDRPSAIETFQTALQFARSPADQRIISSIARGITPVQPPPEGTVQRVGPQPDFLVQAYQDFQRRTQAGRAPTEEEATSLSARAAAGQTPETDTLQMRLEAMEADIARKDRESEARITTIFADMERKNKESEAKVMKYTSKPSETVTPSETVVSPKTTETVADTIETVEAPTGTSMADYDYDPEWAASFDPDRMTGIQAHEQAVSNRAAVWEKLGAEQQDVFARHFARNINPNLSQEDLAKGGALESFQHTDIGEFERMITTGLSATETPITTEFNISGKAGGGIVGNREITVVGEKGPEIAMMPPGTHILPLGKATKQDIRAAQSTGRAYQEGGIVFDELAPGLQQLWRGRPITPPRGYLFQQGGLPLPSPQALQNLTPTVRESFYGMAGDIGISPADFRQELQAATPRGTRLPTSRILPLGRRGVR